MKDTFKSNRNDPFLAMAVSRNSVYGRWSYGFGVTTLNDRDAVHMQVKAKLKQGVTEEKVKEAYTLAVAGTQRPTTNQSYVFVSGKNASENYTNVPDRPVVPTVQQSEEYPIKGKEVTKTVGETIENVSNPVSSGFVVRNDDSKKFPDGMSWNWTNGQQPNTNTAGIFKYDVTAHYYDNSSNSTKVTLKVKPKTPVIQQSSVNEKAGKTGQNVVVTVHDGVPNDSVVTLYSGNKVIGTGRTRGQIATINVPEALPLTEITARTSVQNSYGKVESELSAPVRPTEVPDNVAPKVLFNGKELTQNADNTRFIIYRGANFNPTFKVQDDKNNVTLSITGLPTGVADVSKSGKKEFDYTIPDNAVATDAPFGERIATVTATDGHNTAIYKFKYRIVDIQAKNSTTENRAVGSELGNARNYFKVAESNTAENDQYYPNDIQFKWTELDPRTFRPTDVPNTTKLNELGTITKYIPTAVFPNTVYTKRINNVDYTIYAPAKKIVPKTFNVTDNVKPIVKLVQNNQDTTLSESTTTNALPKVTVYRGEKAEITVKASDNTGKLSRFATSGLPSGVTETGASSSDSATDAAPLAHTLSGKVATN
ncbi:MAG: sialoglycan-binding domain-containing protein, partial [Streptococcus mitis]|nr:sialoglycan-binding domain-containing protein [Streptococcus mitis]